jgi:predicted GNAT superfamily acetyltransferase
MQIRPLTSIDECRQVAALEREIWGLTGVEETVPPHVLIVSIKRGAILLGAFDAGGVMQGFVYSTPGVKNGVLTQWSHMLGVLPPVRESGVGARLKLAQREAALQMGIALIEWTFDPLQALNAHLNFAKLGIVAEEYGENVYGESGSPLHRGSPTDRLVAEWHLTRPHVERRIAAWGQPVVRDRSVAGAVLVNGSLETAAGLAPGRADLAADARRLLVEIPSRFQELQENPDLALAWRLHTREIFQAYFDRGYCALDFFLARNAGRGHYLLARDRERDGEAPQ